MRRERSKEELNLADLRDRVIYLAKIQLEPEVIFIISEMKISKL